MKFVFVFLAAACLCGCISTQEMPLAPNVVRLDTHASGVLFAGQSSNQTMRRAAELTLQNGYSHFRFEDASMSQGSRYAGTYTSVSSNSAISTPLYRPTSNVGVTVIMFHADQPEAKDSFDAAEVLRKMAG